MCGCDGRRTIKLFCPSVSKLVGFPAWDENNLDLGSISRAFGLEPSTVKLNGHFISRGVDLVSTAVTWRSLLSFFSAKGLSTGADDSNAVIVEGKLSKVGSKRGQEPEVVSNNHHGSGTRNASGGTVLFEDVELLKCKKAKEMGSDYGERDGKLSKWVGPGNKRKQVMEDVISLKKLKLQETVSDRIEKKRDSPNFIVNTPYKLCHLNGNMKRTRYEELMVALPYKRFR